jgi:hypothetical protein
MGSQQHERMKWFSWARGMAYFVVAAMMLLSLQACTFLNPCSPPFGEEQLLSDYRSQTVWGALPASVAQALAWNPTEGPGRSVVRYCDNVAIDSLHYSHETAIRVAYLPTGYWPVATLLDAFNPAATTSGWSGVGTGQADGISCGLKTEEGGVPECSGTGILFCKVIDGVTTDFAVTSDSRSDIPKRTAGFYPRMFDRRDQSSCANSS